MHIDLYCMRYVSLVTQYARDARCFAINRIRLARNLEPRAISLAEFTSYRGFSDKPSVYTIMTQRHAIRRQ